MLPFLFCQELGVDGATAVLQALVGDLLSTDLEYHVATAKVSTDAQAVVVVYLEEGVLWDSARGREVGDYFLRNWGAE